MQIVQYLKQNPGPVTWITPYGEEITFPKRRGPNIEDYIIPDNEAFDEIKYKNVGFHLAYGSHFDKLAKVLANLIKRGWRINHNKTIQASAQV